MNDLKKKLPSNVPREKIAELDTAVRRIVETGLAEMIILFGSYVRGDFKLRQGQRSGKISDFDLLVIAPNSMAEEELKRDLYSKFDDIATRVQPIVETIHTVNQKLEQGYFFYAEIKQEGIVLFDTRKYTLSELKMCSPQERLNAAEQDFKMWFEQALEFWDAFQNKHNKIEDGHSKARACAFFLQQTAEMCYKTVLMVLSRYIPSEHYLYVLRHQADALDARVSMPFPMDNEREADLFQHLDNAYIGARYLSDKEYLVTKEQVNYWASEVEKLLKLTEEICREKIATLSRLTL